MNDVRGARGYQGDAERMYVGRCNVTGMSTAQMRVEGCNGAVARASRDVEEEKGEYKRMNATASSTVAGAQ